ncbi:MAG: translation initiation factor IF-3 [Syntrophales bacterium]|nr:translation initiation factor IF-3 [Syntrophales bacterium]MCU0582717.1 translation initiation factor IF-3 [Syntrophales bacterium]
MRVIDFEGKQLGILPIAEALAEAGKVGMDLVEVAPNSSPPVCRIMDYGKFRYQQSKKLQVARKSAATVQIKEMRLRPKIDEHDREIKIRKVKEFLEEGDKVKISMLFRGREIAYTGIGLKIMESIRDELESIATVEQQPRIEGRSMVMVVSPKK